MGESAVVERLTSSDQVRAEVAELLGIDPEELDPHADLIASGLDSIRMMSLSGRWRRQGVDVGFAMLAANPTVQAWTDLLADHAPAQPGPAGPLDSGDDATDGQDPDAPFPLAPIQHAMWVGRQEEQQLGGVSSHLYVEFDGAGVDAPRLRAAAAKLAARHPMLRVEILSDGTQRIGGRGLPVTVHDLRALGSRRLLRPNWTGSAMKNRISYSTPTYCRSRCHCLPTAAPGCTSTWICRQPTRSATAT